MQGQMTVIATDGTITKTALDRAPDYKALKAALDGGMLEVVPYWKTNDGKGCVAFCDEEGKLKGLPLNEKATAAWHGVCPDFIGVDVLVGPVVIVSGDDELLAEL